MFDNVDNLSSINYIFGRKAVKVLYKLAIIANIFLLVSKSVVEGGVLPHMRRNHAENYLGRFSPPDIALENGNNGQISTTSNERTYHRSGKEDELLTNVRKNVLDKDNENVMKHLKEKNGKEYTQAVVYLVKYGYLPENLRLINKVTMKKALSNFQKMSNIPVTGSLTEQTIQVMKEPRCGQKDGDGTDSLSRRQKRYALKISTINGHSYVRRWKKRHITYKITNYTSDLTVEQIDTEIRLAFERWSNASSLVFEETICDVVDSQLYFATHDHGTCHVAFDGRGNVLAHGFAPPSVYCEYCGDVHFDDDELWISESGVHGTTYLAVSATHEIGHTLGLSHSSNSLAIMYYRERIGPSAELHQDDIDGLNELYGGVNVTHNQNDKTDLPLAEECVKPVPGLGHDRDANMIIAAHAKTTHKPWISTTEYEKTGRIGSSSKGTLLTMCVEIYLIIYAFVQL